MQPGHEEVLLAPEELSSTPEEFSSAPELEVLPAELLDDSNTSAQEMTVRLKKEISIIGLGGIGCPLAQYLISAGIKKLNIFDGDTIKKTNLNRQTLYSIHDIGKKKSTIAKKKLLGTNPNAVINSYNHKITKDNLHLLKNSSIIIDASDNWETMRLINKYTTKKNLPLLSISVVGFDIQMILFENTTHNHLCLECIFPNHNEPELARCDTVGIMGTAAGLAGIISAQKAINFLLKFNEKNNYPRKIDIDILDFNKFILNSEVLTLPHPKIRERLFVLKPWNDISPDYFIADSDKSINELMLLLDSNDKIVKFYINKI